jgi:DNA-binding NtrC family response regulator
MCVIDQAEDYEGATRLLHENHYDAAILDIMGVRGYDLLDETTRKGIPTLMLTAHALTADNFVKSIRSGAHAYVPKDRITDIALFLKDVIEAQTDDAKKAKWFKRLENFFEDKFGKEWREREDKEFWEKYSYI